ncbi:4-hydroxy-3-polyprenylbenzoate decarboxylase [Amphibacillus marinus]|uniref:Flavin prenyltransferase UbiX n=1 Tax=Amphibacillus marinus TaxID=872970 RepID=A0A1H8RC95_9BACI|nr:flavin prenyltransferase UbiX [Amphibacillus marinus]SEO63972.1 4-hydroxy-3-polyprenylbenzoate decarboxylase [Amphibacillus marinus]
MERIVIGLTGASGSIYGKRLIEVLLKQQIETHVILTDTAQKVFTYEIQQSVKSWLKELQEKYAHFQLERNDNLFARVASGSYHYDGMVILPCSMGTLAEVSHGLAKNLLCRAADVCLKEKRPLVIVPRETPLNAIHLENMLKLANQGVTILPAMPGFYHHPTSLEAVIDFVVGKILDQLSLKHDLYKKWGDE